MTDTVKAVVLARFGGTDAFELRDLRVPQVGPRQVRVCVHATAITGHDISGVIEEVGSHVIEFRAGDEVYYTPRIFGGPGSYAEQHVADVDLVGRSPRT